MDESRTGSGNQESPELLLARHLAGDADSFESLVGFYEERLFAFIARFVGDWRLAEDVFQRTFIKAAENAADFDGNDSFSAWLYRIARNTAIDELRRRRHDPAHAACGTGDPGGLRDGNAVPPLDGTTGGEPPEMVRPALAALPDPQREAFLLREEAGFDFERIGVIMNCGRETAKSRFRLAVARLRGAFDGSER